MQLDNLNLSGVAYESKRKAEQRKIDEAEPLSLSEKEEMEALLEPKRPSEKTHDRVSLTFY